MKKILSFSFILLSLSILINCSPKTAKKVASSKSEVSKSEAVAPTFVPLSNKEFTRDSEPVKSDVSAVLNEMSSDQQMNLFQELAPLRIELGKKIYTQQCNKCHEFYEPNSRRAEVWVEVMRKMGPQAKLNTDQYMMVAGYLVQNAKK